MADAKKCDVCGAFYDDYGIAVNDFSKVNSTTLEYRNSGKATIVVSYELCPDCMGELLDWVNRKGDLND